MLRTCVGAVWFACDAWRGRAGNVGGVTFVLRTFLRLACPANRLRGRVAGGRT